MSSGQQPALHDLVTTLCAPNVALSAADGQIRGVGAHGVYRHDRRSLALLDISVDGAVLLPLGRRALDANRTRFDGVVRADDDIVPDPRLHYVRQRHVSASAFSEEWTVHNHSEQNIRLPITLRAATDMMRMDLVKAGVQAPRIEPKAAERTAAWESDGCRVRAVLDRTANNVSIADDVVAWTWHVTVAAGKSWTVRTEVEQYESDQDAFLPQRPAEPVRLVAPDAGRQPGDAARLLEHSLNDLDSLLLADPTVAGSVFLAAGSPWFFTLFGRDSLWAARFLLPLNTDLAAGTLRVLAARQGTRHDPETEEQPGKMLHEMRRSAIDVDTGTPLHLPPLYYGTVDATPLWVCLLHDAWRAGLPSAEVEHHLPALRAALDWMVGPGDPDGDGFCEYRGSSGGGLANQGWKDSGDGVRWADGTLACRPLALCEVQGYAHAAALGGGALLDAFGDDGSPWRTWAAGMRERFRDRFWVDDEHGRYPAIALDGDKRPVTGPASNMAHLLGTGILDEDEARLVAEQLASPELDSGYGLRTLSARTAGFSPFSYHCGSVWPHDTAIAVLGLAAEGLHEQARVLAEGLMSATAAFEHRMPELFGGTDRHAEEPVVAYPAACRPQAWSAAGAVAAVGYLEGWYEFTDMKSHS